MHPHRLEWEFACDGSIISIAATPNFSTIAAATVGKSLYLLDGQGRPIWQKPYEVDAEGWSTDVSADGQFIAVGTASKKPADGTLYVFTRGQRLFWSKRIRSPIWGVSLSANGDTLAASTWGGNKVYIFKRDGSNYAEVGCYTIPGDKGLYGCRLTANGQLCLVASYDNGLYLLEQNGRTVASASISTGVYNLALARGNNTAVTGLREGAFGVASLEDDIEVAFSKQISQRPICGIAVTDNGSLVASGSHDGRLIVSNEHGAILWEYQTKGEIWTTAISSNGTLVAAGCGDHRIRVFSNKCDTAAYQEIQALEVAVESTSAASASSSLETLISLYLKYGLTEYGHSRLTHFLRENPDAHIFKDELRKFLEASVKLDGGHPQGNFWLGCLLSEEKKYLEAICQFQLAATEPAMKSAAQRRSAEAFAELSLNTAATSAWRQSREQHLDDNARHVLYMLARSYEDTGNWREASKIYEMILSWDADFRNSWDKLQAARSFVGSSTGRKANQGKDYTGVTISLLGPDAPRELDSSLQSVIEARSKEVLIKPGERVDVENAVHDLLGDDDYSRGIRRDIAKLGYDLQLFLKYDFGLPEDEMKKFLETVNAYPHFRRVLDGASSPRSLDIGSATGRYPSLLKRLGFGAYGIDIEKQAIEYSKKKTSNAEWPKFICGDACEMDKFIDTSLTFDCVTCMMGTFEHISRDKQGDLIKKVYSRLNKGGVCVISVWDVECPHLAYLSIYDEGQKDLIRQNSRTRSEMEALFADAGYSEVQTVPFSLLPETVIYDLGIEQMQADDISIAAQADLAARALFSDRHGEMFLAIGYKHPA